jgi:succinate-semialdehyde dehydrogenase
MSSLTTVNPATGEPLAAYPHTSERELDALLESAVRAVQRRREEPLEARAAQLRELARQLRAGAAQHALLISTEMGKPLAQARAELEKCAVLCEYYAERLAEWLAPSAVDIPGESARVQLRPLGVVLCVMPWNYPFWQVFRAALGALALGGAVLLKHADNVSGCAQALRALFDAVLGPGALACALLPPERVGPLLGDPRIAALAFTGSPRVGALLAARAGAAVKKSVLELGGSDPFIVLADADVKAAAAAAARSRFLNCGQSCIAAKRLIVERPVYADFAAALCAEVRALAYGDPLAPGTDVGPMARTDLRDALRRQLDAALLEGARLLVGGEPDARPGAWFAPALLELPAPSSPVFREETFGPLGALLQVPSEQAAIALANASVYGLSASLWTRDLERAQALGSRLETGALFVNRISESDPRLPVGGVKASGYGRELGAHGLLEFANVQSVRIAQAR